MVCPALKAKTVAVTKVYLYFPLVLSSKKPSRGISQIQLFLIPPVPNFLGLLPFRDKAIKLKDCLHGYFSVSNGGKEVLLNITIRK